MLRSDFPAFSKNRKSAASKPKQQPSAKKPPKTFEAVALSPTPPPFEGLVKRRLRKHTRSSCIARMEPKRVGKAEGAAVKAPAKEERADAEGRRSRCRNGSRIGTKREEECTEV
ncbi:hypothetical protein L596_001250 [Steinernema carpocapsae]|uniref:Uncharacterized protein n=1 Tax=Steinernema carpocapsae TaxID=34508 RepID=A0A4U8UPR2_STECR|nr:hypothetical protein L596_001250 [Steinernema carpocapsae]